MSWNEPFLSDPERDALLTAWARDRVDEALRKGRRKGRRGWHDPDCVTDASLLRMVDEHIGRGPAQYVDAAVLLLMLAWRREHDPAGISKR